MKVVSLKGSGATEALFIPGFLAAPSQYRSFLQSLRSDFLRLLAISQARREQLTRVGVDSGVRALTDIATGRWVIGHSRGGQIAYRLATEVPVSGVILIDPVAGTGRKGPLEDLPRLPQDLPSLTIGAGIAGRCNPTDRGYAVFTVGTTVVIPSLGHADVLDDDLRGRMARRICGSEGDPAAARLKVVDAVTRFLGAHNGLERG